MTSIGWAIVAVTCFGGDYNCDIKAVVPTTYPTQQDCEWAKQTEQSMHPGKDLKCVEIQRPDKSF